MDSLIGYVVFIVLMLLAGSLVEARERNKKLEETLALIGLTEAQIDRLTSQKDRLSQLVDAADVLSELHLKMSTNANNYGFAKLIEEGFTQKQAEVITGLYLLGKTSDARDFERKCRRQNAAEKADACRAAAAGTTIS